MNYPAYNPPAHDGNIAQGMPVNQNFPVNDGSNNAHPVNNMPTMPAYNPPPTGAPAESNLDDLEARLRALDGK